MKKVVIAIVSIIVTCAVVFGVVCIAYKPKVTIVYDRDFLLTYDENEQNNTDDIGNTIIGGTSNTRIYLSSLFATFLPPVTVVMKPFSLQQHICYYKDSAHTIPFVPTEDIILRDTVIYGLTS